MNCLDCTRYVREAVDSVYAQTLGDWEIIFWDNASSEDVQGVLTDYDERLRYFRGDRTVTLGEARNLAMAQAHGDLLAFLDCDDIWLPNKLERQVGSFDEEQVGLSYTDWVLFNERGYSRARFGDTPAPQGWVFEQVLLNNFTCLSTLMVRGSLVREDEIKFDVQLTYVEDSDFITRVAREARVAYVPMPLTRYRMHEASATTTKVHMFRDEQEYLAEKYRNIFPEFSDRYAERFHAGIVKARAMDNWRQGNRRLTRQLLRTQLGRGWRVRLIYLASYLPYSWVNWVHMRSSGKVTDYQI